jgi:hypothetical protein
VSGFRSAEGRPRVRIIVAALLTALAAANPTAMAQPAGSLATATVARSDQDRAQAQSLYEDCHWADAYAMFAALADAGDARAAQVALLMARHGPRLYGQAFTVTPLQAATWTHQAIEAIVAERGR